jgi:hypothetical protein
MSEEKRLRLKVIVSGFIFIGITILLMKVIGNSYLVTIFFVVGWIIFFAYLLKIRSMGKR